MNVNDLERQYRSNIEGFSRLGAVGNNEVEFDPIGYQTGSVNKIPQEIINLMENSLPQMRIKAGFLIDNIVYFIANKRLYLWNYGRLTHGIAGYRNSNARVFDYSALGYYDCKD